MAAVDVANNLALHLDLVLSTEIGGRQESILLLPINVVPGA